MTLPETLQSRIESTIASSPVVLFMKGTREQPQCGFSATVIGILNNVGADYETVNVLEDQEIREGIKVFSDWPTIPQLYIEQEFVGGCDVIQQMYTSGDLHQMLGREVVDAVTPTLNITDAAAAAIRDVAQQRPEFAVHLQIDAGYNHQFSLAPARGHEISAMSNGVTVLFDRDSAARADGLTVDMADTPQGPGFSITNPNAPPSVPQMPVTELKRLLDEGAPLHLYDVREQAERDIAAIEGSVLLDEQAVSGIDALPRDATLVFHCHSGVRSQSAAEYFRDQGFTNVFNLAGGIDAWSQEVDPSVPRY